MEIGFNTLKGIDVPLIENNSPCEETILEVINSSYVEMGKGPLAGRNILLRHHKSKVMAFCSLHPSRLKFLPAYLKQMMRNKVDVMWHINNIPQNLPSQVLGEIHSQKFLTESEYKFYWSDHSDIIPPPFAAKRLASHGKDIISAIVPKPLQPPLNTRGMGAYIGYVNPSFRRRVGFCWRHMFCYLLAPGQATEFNPASKVLDYSNPLLKVASLGWGSLMLSKAVLEVAGWHLIGGRFRIERGPLDTLWSKYIYDRKLFDKFVDTTVRCRHLSHPLGDMDAENPWLPRDEADKEIHDKGDWLKDDWYGWKLEDEE